MLVAATLVALVAGCGSGNDGASAADDTTIEVATPATDATEPEATTSTSDAPTTTATTVAPATGSTRPPLDLRPRLLGLSDLPEGFVTELADVNFRPTVPIADPCGVEVLPMAAYPGVASAFALPPTVPPPTAALDNVLTAMQQMPELGPRSVPAEMAVAVATCPAEFPSREEQYTTSVRLLEPVATPGIEIAGFEHSYATGPVASRRLVYVFQLDELVGTLVIVGTAADPTQVEGLAAPVLTAALAKLDECVTDLDCTS